MHYRLYALNDSGRIVNGRDIIADTDGEAMGAAAGIYPDTPFELWCQSRRVCTSVPDDAGRMIRPAPPAALSRPA